MAQAATREALLDDAIDAFEHISTKIASHKDWSDGTYPYPQPSVYLVAHLAEMWSMGWGEVDFDTLAVVSGSSALFGYETDSFMPKYANLHIGIDDRVAEGTGFGYEWVAFEDAESAWKLLGQTIDTGRPMKGYDWENVLFAGYCDASKPRERKVFAMGDGPEYFVRWWDWPEFSEWADRMGKWNSRKLGRHTRRVTALPEKLIAQRVMRDLVEWSTSPPAECTAPTPNATFGLAGIGRYADDLADVEAHPDWIMCHGINPLWALRHSTAVYLEGLAEAGLFRDAVTEGIAAAAREYRGAYDAWRQCYGLLGHGASEEERRSPERRSLAADLVLIAVDHETAAIDHLRSVLMHLGHTDAGA